MSCWALDESCVGRALAAQRAVGWRRLSSRRIRNIDLTNIKSRELVAQTLKRLTLLSRPSSTQTLPNGRPVASDVSEMLVRPY